MILHILTSAFVCATLIFACKKSPLLLGGVNLEIQWGVLRLTLNSLVLDIPFWKLHCTTSRITIQLHIPTRSMPRWCVFTAADYSYQDPQNHVTSSMTTATLWFFPSLFSSDFSHNDVVKGKYIGLGGSLVSTEIEDLRVLVYTSTRMPNWIDRLRRNAMTALFNGKHIRADDFEVHVKPCIKSAPFSYATTSDEKISESRITIHAKEWHVFYPYDTRMYCFGGIDGQLRKIWDKDEGTLVLIGKDCRWVHATTNEGMERLPFFQ
jgi:hypothetical protein